MKPAPRQPPSPPAGLPVHTLGSMTLESGLPEDPASAALKASLRRVFDSQIPNYGDYNLVCATPAADSSGFFVLGYRWRPPELVFAPFSVDSMESLAPPTAVNSTNLSHADEVAPESYEVGTTAGRVFRFSVVPEPELPPAGGGSPRRLEQDGDCEDFNSFLDTFLELG